ncbi:MAG: alpha/beta hydrolase [Bacteroides sp.]|nr:alpha/beta hydrolase [Bacteroides sp.]
MSRIFGILCCAAALMPSGAFAEGLTGAWSGKLNVTPQNALRIVFNVDGESVTMDSPDQNAYGIPCEVAHLSADSLNVGVKRLGMNYAGALRGDSLVGTFRQGMYRFPLTLSPGVKKAVRPQTPQPPFPYTSEDVTVIAADAVLAGTLTMPAGASADTPVALLVSGSGLQNRDEELFEHRPFAVLADFLARNGIATLRYDDRGCGESKGDARNATTADFAADAEAAVRWLRSSGRFSKVGLIGHSEGGIIGYMLGARPETLDFIISVAGPSVPGETILTYQNTLALIDSGKDEATAEQMARTIVANLMEQKSTGPWMAYFLRQDPASAMKDIHIPAFIIYGEKDTQVPPSLNLGPAQAAAPQATVKTYPGLNHLMQHASTGRLSEYVEIEETIAPEVLTDIAAFIRSL